MALAGVSLLLTVLGSTLNRRIRLQHVPAVTWTLLAFLAVVLVEDTMVAAAVLSCPKVNEQEVEAFSKMTNVNADDLEIEHNESAHRFEVHLGDGLAEFETLAHGGSCVRKMPRSSGAGDARVPPA